MSDLQAAIAWATEQLEEALNHADVWRNFGHKRLAKDNDKAAAHLRVLIAAAEQAQAQEPDHDAT